MQRIPLTLAACLIAVTSISQDGADLYKKSCAACHSIGGGRMVGPDLAGVTKRFGKAWLTKFIRNSAEMIKSGDQAAVAVGKEYNNLLMPPYVGSDHEITAIINYIESKGGSAQSAVADTFLNAATDENTARGKLLFAGEVRFKNGGASCIACHAVHDDAGTGGGLAKSLNLSYVMLTGQGVKAMLQSPPFPAMAAAYNSHSLTGQEIYDLTAYMRSVSQAMVKGETTTATVPFLLVGIAGWGFLMFLLFGLWHMRKRLSVNHAIFARQLATEK